MAAKKQAIDEVKKDSVETEVVTDKMPKAKQNAKQEEPVQKMSLGRMAQVLSSKYLKTVEKKYGEKNVQLATTKPVACKRIPTGIFPLDYALGGGFPVGRIINAFGPQSSGKTTVLLFALASALSRCASCLDLLDSCKCKYPREGIGMYIDVEGTFDPKWAETLGVPLSRLLISTPTSAEEAADTLDAMLRSNEVDYIALDSLAMLSPEKEIEKQAGEAIVGTQSMMIRRAMRKATAAMNELGNLNEDGRKPTLFLTNHLTQKIGVMYGSPDTQPGGTGHRFAASIEVKHMSGKFEMDDASKQPISVELRFRIEKNKVAPPHMEGSFQLFFKDTEFKKCGEVADEDSILTLSERTGFLQYTQGQGWQVLDKLFRVKDDALKALILDKEFSARWRVSLMSHLLADV